MTSALFVVGAGYFVTAAGLPGVRVPARIVLMVAGLSSIGIAAITIWPALTARRAPSQPLIRARGAGAVTAVFLALRAWVVFETQGGTALGLAERLVSAVQVTWPFVVARRHRRPWPGPGRRVAPAQERSNNAMTDLKGKTALVTGSTSGIGTRRAMFIFGSTLRL